MSGIPRQIRQWVIATIKRKLISFMSDLSVPESILQPYIVKKTEAVLPPVAGATQNNTDEPMELDSPATSTSSNESVSINLSDDGDPLPAVVIGSEPWHSQVPAVGFSLSSQHFFFENVFVSLGMGSNYCQRLTKTKTAKSTATI